MIRRAIGRLRRDQSGVSAVEFALLLPLLLAVLLGSVTMFDLFRKQQSAEKVTFTVGDMLSRQKDAITGTLLTSMVTFMQKTVDVTGAARLRVTSISNVAGTLTQEWTWPVNDAFFAGKPIDYSIVPDIAVGDSVILTESFIPHRAMVAGFGVDEVIYTNKAAHRPRFVGKIAFQ